MYSLGLFFAIHQKGLGNCIGEQHFSANQLLFSFVIFLPLTCIG